MHGHFTSNKSPFFRKQSDYDVIALRQVDEEERRLIVEKRIIRSLSRRGQCRFNTVGVYVEKPVKENRVFTREDFQKWGSIGGTKSKNSHKLSSKEARRIAKIRHGRKKK